MDNNSDNNYGYNNDIDNNDNYYVNNYNNGYNTNNNVVSSALQKRRDKQNVRAARTVQALDNVADVVQYTPAAGYAKAYKSFRKVDNIVTGGRISKYGAKLVNNSVHSSDLALKIASSKKINNRINSYGKSAGKDKESKAGDSNNETNNVIDNENTNNNTQENGGSFEVTVYLSKLVKWAAIGVSCFLVLVVCCVICYSARQLMSIFNIDLANSVSDDTIQSGFSDKQSEIFDVNAEGEYNSSTSSDS